MSRKVTVNNDAISKDKDYVPYISRSDARRKGIKRLVEPVHAMEPHIRAMAPSSAVPNNQIHTRGTNSPYNKKGRLVRREYMSIIKNTAAKVVRKFIMDYQINTKITKKNARPNMVISHKLSEPIIRNGKTQRFVAMALIGNMFKTVIKRNI